MPTLVHLPGTYPGLQAHLGQRLIERRLGRSMTVQAEAPAGGQPIRAWLDRALGRRPFPQADIIHAWDAGSLAPALASGKPIVLTLTRMLSWREVRWLRALFTHQSIELICPTFTIRRLCIERGLPIEHCHLIRPAVDFGQLRGRDEALRAALGFSPTDRVILLDADPSPAADPNQAIWVASILAAMEPGWRALLWKDRADRAMARFADGVRGLGMLSVATNQLASSIEYARLIGAADFALFTPASAGSPMAMSLAMAGRLPIVSIATPSSSELLEDRHTALLSTDRDVRRFAQRLLQFAADPALGQRLAEQAAAEAYEYLSATAFAESHRLIYEALLAKQRVVLPDVVAGAAVQGLAAPVALARA